MNITKLSDVKDMTPNTETVEHLERLLDLAKQGQVRSIISVVGYDDQTASCGWYVDWRSDKERLAGKLHLLNQDFAANVLLCDDNSALARSLK